MQFIKNNNTRKHRDTKVLNNQTFTIKQSNNHTVNNSQNHPITSLTDPNNEPIEQSKIKPSNHLNVIKYANKQQSDTHKTK